MSHGLVMRPEHCDPSHLTKLGTITIAQDRITFAGFSSDNSTSCRQTAAQAPVSAIQVLQAELAADMARPGGGKAGRRAMRPARLTAWVAESASP